MFLDRLHRAVRARQPRRQIDAGFGVLEAVIATPVLLLLTMLSVQYVLVWHSRNVAEAAARDGLRVARGYGSTGSRGAAACADYLHEVAPKMLHHPRCAANRANRTAIVHVHAAVTSVVPFGSFSVDESASGPVEAFGGS